MFSDWCCQKHKRKGGKRFKHLKRNASQRFLSLSYQGSLFTEVVGSTLPALHPCNPYGSPIQGVWFGQTIPSTELSVLENSKRRGDPQPPKKYVVMQRCATPAENSQMCFYLWKTFQQLLREACLVPCIILRDTLSSLKSPSLG